jgi:receptor protein-tyrosine kinase
VDLIGYLRLLRRRWWIISLAILVSVGAAIATTAAQHKRYQTGTRLLVSGSSTLSPVDEITRRQLAQQRAVLFSQIATTSPVIAAAEQAADSNGGTRVENANPSVSASATGNDPFLTITVTADTPQAAQQLANAFSGVLPTELTKLDQVPSAVKALLTVVNPAGLPSKPASPKPIRNILIGLALGIVLGVAAALIRETLDTTLRDSEEVRRMTRSTILGIVPREFDDERLPAATRPHSRRSEAYRQVRTNLEFAADDEATPHSFVVTSAGQGEGKSTTAANLALLISRAGKSVAVVDADLRKPTLASLFNATSDYGLSDVLTGRRTLASVVQPIAGERIVVISTGPSVARPSELLSSPAMEHILAELGSQFDVVIVDSPPVLAITDALLVGKHTDGMVLVVRMRRTTRSGLRRSIEAIERVHARLLGLVVNAATEAEDKRYGYTKGYTKGYLSTEREDAQLHPGGGQPPVAAAAVPAQAAPPFTPPPFAPPPYAPAPASTPAFAPPAFQPPPMAPPPAEQPPLAFEPPPAAAPPPPVAEQPPPAVPEPAAPEPAAPEAAAPEPATPEPAAPPVAVEPAAPAYQPTHQSYEPAHESYEPAPQAYEPPPQAGFEPSAPAAPAVEPPAAPAVEPEPSSAPSGYQPQLPEPSSPYAPPPGYLPPPPPVAPPAGPAYWRPEQLEQPQPTFQPPADAGSVGAVDAGRQPRGRSGGRRRRGAAGKADAEQQEGQRDDAGRPVDVDHPVQQLSGDDAHSGGRHWGGAPTDAGN